MQSICKNKKLKLIFKLLDLADSDSSIIVKDLALNATDGIR